MFTGTRECIRCSKVAAPELWWAFIKTAKSDCINIAMPQPLPLGWFTSVNFPHTQSHKTSTGSKIWKEIYLTGLFVSTWIITECTHTVVRFPSATCTQPVSLKDFHMAAAAVSGSDPTAEPLTSSQRLEVRGSRLRASAEPLTSISQSKLNQQKAAASVTASAYQIKTQALSNASVSCVSGQERSQGPRSMVPWRFDCDTKIKE